MTHSIPTNLPQVEPTFLTQNTYLSPLNLGSTCLSSLSVVQHKVSVHLAMRCINENLQKLDFSRSRNVKCFVYSEEHYL